MSGLKLYRAHESRQERKRVWGQTKVNAWIFFDSNEDCKKWIPTLRQLTGVTESALDFEAKRERVFEFLSVLINFDWDQTFQESTRIAESARESSGLHESRRECTRVAGSAREWPRAHESRKTVSGQSRAIYNSRPSLETRFCFGPSLRFLFFWRNELGIRTRHINATTRLEKLMTWSDF